LGILLQKSKEVLYSVLPITVIVLLLHFAATPLPGQVLARFLIGAALIIAGLAVFLAGVDLGITPLGNHVGAAISRTNRVWIVVAVGLVLGFFICIAEPDLQILAGQVAGVSGGAIPRAAILLTVSVGIAVMLAAGMLRIVYNVPLYRLMTGLYGAILLLSLLAPPEILAIAFDASGATTGALTVPFILALALGASALKKDSKASEKDSFGLVGVASTGAILGVLLMGLLNLPGDLTGGVPHGAADPTGIVTPFLRQLPGLAAESAMAMLPLAAILIVFQLRVLHFSKRRFRRMLKGLGYTWLGLALFLTGVHAGFMQVGVLLGYKIAMLPQRWIVPPVGLALGLVTILAEPAVHILTRQIETVTSGSIKRGIVLAALSLGVGAAVALSILRILIPGIQLWHYLLPGFGLAIAMSFFAPKLFVGIAFDAGGVASGPMTATFILAFAQGVADSIPAADVLRDAFGMIALVAMTPILALEALGIVYKRRSHRAAALDRKAVSRRADPPRAKKENVEKKDAEIKDAENQTVENPTAEIKNAENPNVKNQKEQLHDGV
jgi:hypothetical protein